jgi:hypothetical protein
MIEAAIVSTYNAKGVNQATKSLSKFDKSVLSLGKSFAGVFAASKVIQFGKASAKAFMEDQKSAALLAGQLKNLGLAYSTIESEKFIKSMEGQVNIADDQLRPAYSQLARVTGSISKTQKIMGIAFDTASGAGISYGQTIDILSQAYVGNLKGLKQLNLGLDSAALKALSFDDLLVLLNKHFRGEGAAALSGYQSKLDSFNITLGNVKENIGGGLLDSFAQLAGNGNMDKATSKLETFSMALAEMMRLATGVKKVDWKYGFIPVDKKVTKGVAGQSPATRAAIDLGNAKAKADAAKLAKAKKDEFAMLQAKNKLTMAEAQAKLDQAKLDELKKKFDIERIGIAAGIARTQDELSKTTDAAARANLLVELDRLKLQQAIIDENAALAAKVNEALKKAEADKVTQETLAATNLARLATNAGGAADAIRKMTDAATAFGLSISAYQGFRAGERGDTTYIPPTIPPVIPPVVPPVPPIIPPTIPPIIPPIIDLTKALADAEAASQAAADAIDAGATSAGALLGDTSQTDLFGAVGGGIDLDTLASDAAAALVDSVAAVIATDAAATLADSWAAVDWADALASIYGTDKGSKDAMVPHGAYDPGPSIDVTINAGTIVDPTTLVEMVQNAVITNNRYGNSMVPTGTIAI